MGQNPGFLLRIILDVFRQHPRCRFTYNTNNLLVVKLAKKILHYPTWMIWVWNVWNGFGPSWNHFFLLGSYSNGTIFPRKVNKIVQTHLFQFLQQINRYGQSTAEKWVTHLQHLPCWLEPPLSRPEICWSGAHSVQSGCQNRAYRSIQCRSYRYWLV